MKQKPTVLEKKKWYCSAGAHWVIGGNRYANFEGGHDCAKCTPYLKDP